MQRRILATSVILLIVIGAVGLGAPTGGRLPWTDYQEILLERTAGGGEGPVAPPEQGETRMVFTVASVEEQEYIFVSSTPITAANVAELDALGLSVSASVEGLTVVKGPLVSFAGLGPYQDALPWVETVLPALPLLLSDSTFPSGLVSLSEKDLLEAVGADWLRASGLRGRGVRIAVLDGGFTGELKDLLPGSDVRYLKIIYDEAGVPQLAEGFYEGLHGEACAQAIAKIAPEARYYLVSLRTLEDRKAFLQFVLDGKLDVDIISDSTFWALPLDHNDGRGDLALLAKEVVESGVSYFYAVGNFGMGESTDRAFYCGTFSNDDRDGALSHDFDPEASSELDRNTLSIEVKDWEGGEKVPLWIALEWDGWPWQVKGDPEAMWTTDSIVAIQDLDLCLYYQASDGTVEEVAKSDINQLLTLYTDRVPPKPLEYLTKVDLDRPGTYLVRVSNMTLAHTAPVDLFERAAEFHLYVYLPEGGTTFTLEHHTLDGCLLNEGAGAVVGVGAVGKADQGWCVLPFSSRGPTADGRVKPELVAPTEYESNVFGGAFGGTSAAAPVAAGVAALLLGNWPGLTQQELLEALVQGVTPLCGVLDMNGACMTSCGCNNVVGHGLLNGWQTYLHLKD